jgi:hypothetical protein
MSKIHILNQYIWPDGSPVCVYAEQLAEKLSDNGMKVVMVGGAGIYRKNSRTKPTFPIHRFEIPTFPRNTFIQILKEYYFVIQKLREYIVLNIKPKDVVIVTSSPFLNVFLISHLKKKNTKNIYWLSDYYPDSLLSLSSLYLLVKPALDFIWKTYLRQWDVVVKISDNLNYYGKNAITFRFWPTIKKIKKTHKNPNMRVLYTGNLGITHDVKALVDVAKEYYQKGYEINFYADGPKINELPDWIHKNATFQNENDLIDALINHEIHLVAGTVNNDGGSFPSKTWNSIASGRKVIPCGFVGKMHDEFQLAIKSDYSTHLDKLASYIINITR